MSDGIVQGAHGCSREDSYVQPTDPLVRERMEWFRDQKLALRELSGLGAWLKRNGDAIYGTRPCDIPRHGNLYFTQKDGGNTVFALLPLEEGDLLSDALFIPTEQAVSRVALLDSAEILSFMQTAEGITVKLPHPISGKETLAAAFKLQITDK